MRIVAFLCCLCLAAAAVAESPAMPTGNPSSDKLLGMPEYGQAAMLSKATGYKCLGKKPFYVGTEKSGANEGVSYWSVTCGNGGKQYMIAISPDKVGNTRVFSCNLFTHKPIVCYERMEEK